MAVASSSRTGGVSSGYPAGTCRSNSSWFEVKGASSSSSSNSISAATRVWLAMCVSVQEVCSIAVRMPYTSNRVLPPLQACLWDGFIAVVDAVELVTRLNTVRR